MLHSPADNLASVERLESALESARILLEDAETAIPAGVVQTVRFFVDCGIWFRLSRNPPVHSCREAAAQRYRLGRQGIALADELRSYLAESRDPENTPAYFILHCRGDASIDFDAVAQVDIAKQLRLTRANTKEFGEGDIGYGLINPFSAPEILSARGRVSQIFDPSLLDGSGETATMMTNAGHREWAVEFDPREVIAVAGTEFATIAKITPKGYQRHSEDSAPIGILTGNAPESGALLWRKINRAYRNARGDTFRGDASYPRVLVHSLPAMGWSMEIGTRSARLWPLIAGETEKMAQDGARVIAFACNTTQYFADDCDQILKPYDASYVRLSDTIKKWLIANQKSRVFIVGIGYATSNSDWSAFPFLREMENVVLPTETQSRFIEALAYEVKNNGVTDVAYQKFKSLVRRADADLVLLLLTEASLIFDVYPRSRFGDLQIKDAIDLYAETIVAKSMDAG